MKMFWRLVYIRVYLTLPKGTLKMDKVVNSIIDILLQLELKNIRQTWWCIPVIPVLWEDQELKVNLDYECLKTTTKLTLCVTVYMVLTYVTQWGMLLINACFIHSGLQPWILQSPGWNSLPPMQQQRGVWSEDMHVGQGLVGPSRSFSRKVYFWSTKV